LVPAEKRAYSPVKLAARESPAPRL